MKAYLISKSIEPKRTDKIEKLIDACLHFDDEFEKPSYSVKLTQNAVESSLLVSNKD